MEDCVPEPWCCDEHSRRVGVGHEDSGQRGHAGANEHDTVANQPRLFPKPLPLLNTLEVSQFLESDYTKLIRS